MKLESAKTIAGPSDDRQARAKSEKPLRQAATQSQKLRLRTKANARRGVAPGRVFRQQYFHRELAGDMRAATKKSATTKSRLRLDKRSRSTQSPSRRSVPSGRWRPTLDR